MRLTFEDIKKITFGALRIEECEDGIHFCKMTKKQEEAFLALSEFLYNGARTTTGVRLDFHTNSKNLTFSASSGTKFELYINDVLCRQFNCEELRGEGTPASAELVSPCESDSDTVRVTLVFPSHSVGVLEYIELDDGATVTPHTFDTKILFIGDSITQGWNSKYDSFSYAWRVTRFFNAESVIQGIGGSYFHETTFDEFDFDPDTVIVALGTNDFGHYPTFDEMIAHASAHMDLIAKRYKGKKIFAISPIWREVQQKPSGSFSQLRRLLIEEFEKHSFIHVDGLSLVPHFPEFMADKTLHPNDLGFSLYAENLIEKMLKH